MELTTIAILSATVWCGSSRGQECEAPTLVKATQDAEIWLGMAPAQHDGSTSFNTDFWMGGVKFGRVLTATHGAGWLRGNLQWSMEAIPIFVVSNLESAYGAEFDPLVWRWNFKHNGRTAPYFEMGGGVVFTNSKVPVGDTSKFNVVPKLGFGWQIFTREQNSIDLGVYAWHLSNAWTAPRNPSANAIQLTVGYHWFKKRDGKKANRITTYENGTE